MALATAMVASAGQAQTQTQDWHPLLTTNKVTGEVTTNAVQGKFVAANVSAQGLGTWRYNIITTNARVDHPRVDWWGVAEDSKTHAHTLVYGGCHSEGHSLCMPNDPGSIPSRDVAVVSGRDPEAQIWPNRSKTKTVIAWHMVLSTGGYSCTLRGVSGVTKQCILDTRDWPTGAAAIKLALPDEWWIGNNPL